MAILDHFGYPTYPFINLDDPLWYIREQFQTWLKLQKDRHRLILMKDPAASDFVICQKTQTDSHYTGLEVGPLSLSLPIYSGDKVETKKEKKDSKPKKRGKKVRDVSGSDEDWTPKREKTRKKKYSKSSPKAPTTTVSSSTIAEGEASRPTVGGKSPRIRFSLKPIEVIKEADRSESSQSSDEDSDLI